MSKSEFQQFKSQRDEAIAMMYRNTPEHQRDSVLQRMASEFKITPTRIRNILIEKGEISKRSYSEERQHRAKLLERIRTADVLSRMAIIDEFSKETGRSQHTLISWCRQEGIKVKSGQSVPKAIRIIGLYLQTRSLDAVCKQLDITRAYASRVLALARSAGVLNMAQGALRFDPEIKAQLVIIREANRKINERLVAIGDKAVKGKGGK